MNNPLRFVSKLFNAISLFGNRQGATPEQIKQVANRIRGSQSQKHGSSTAVFDPTRDRLVKSLNRNSHDEIKGVKDHRLMHFLPSWKRDGFPSEEAYHQHHQFHENAGRMQRLHIG